jgi:type IV pilus assembly protein PilQ
MLAGATMVARPGSAQTAQEISATADGRMASISAVDVSREGEQTTVRISGTGNLRFQTSRLDSPPRLVLDFSNTKLATRRNQVTGEYAPVQEVRLGQSASGQSRVVIDLSESASFRSKTEGSSVVISFDTAEPQVTTAASRRNSRSRQQEVASVNVPQMPLPAWLTGKEIGFASPANVPPAPQPQNAAVMPQQAATVSPDKKYTGEPISVNLKDVDLKDFFRLIHEISGLNVVLDPAVHGTVTLVLDEVPWDQGLDIVLRNNGLTKEIDGNVLRIATQATLKSEADARRELIKAQTDAIEPVTVTRVLSYAQATTMTNTLKRFLTARGDVIADTRSNTLIIRDIPSSIPKVDDLLRQLDRKSQQVEIDARVVQATRSFAREVGTQFGFSTPTGSSGNTAIGGLVGSATNISPVINTIAAPF